LPRTVAHVRVRRLSRSWQARDATFKTQLRQQVVIGGFALERGSRSRLGALLLGVYRGKELVYIGSAGTGFNRWTLAEVHEQLKPLISEACPFKRNPKPNKIVRWVRPELVCEISFLCWTSDGHVRHPVFQGMQEGVPVSAVRGKDQQRSASSRFGGSATDRVCRTSQPA
jgi:bifunctional non-homologous end joining protein LigD